MGEIRCNGDNIMIGKQGSTWDIGNTWIMAAHGIMPHGPAPN
jgi:hypothetical protein